MFCTRDAFEDLGPFDERVALGEEWPITAGQWRRNRRRFAYDTRTAATTSGRRMERQPFGYTRTFIKYAAAVVLPAARVRYTDTIRDTPSQAA